MSRHSASSLALLVLVLPLAIAAASSSTRQSARLLLTAAADVPAKPELFTKPEWTSAGGFSSWVARAAAAWQPRTAIVENGDVSITKVEFKPEGVTMRQ